MSISESFAVDTYLEDTQYLWNVTQPRKATEYEVAEAAMWASEVVQTLLGDWLPASESSPGILIESLAEFSDPLVAWDQCFDTSDAVATWWEHSGEAKQMMNFPESVTVVQGLNSQTDGLNYHYALLVVMNPGSNPVIVDFTFSQFDAAATFPYVSSPTAWEQAVLEAANNA